MNKITQTMFVILLACVAMSASAQSTYPVTGADPNLPSVQPYRGTYYDFNQAGTGVQFDVGASGNQFLTYYTYSDDGQPDWYIAAGTYQPSDEVTRWKTGVIGTLTGPFYQAFNGQCLGCPYTPNGGAIVTNVTPTVSWTSSRQMKMTAAGHSWNMTAPNFDTGNDGDYLPGGWAMAVTFVTNQPADGSVRHAMGESVELVPVTIPVVIAPGSERQTALSSTAKVYKVQCGLVLPGGAFEQHPPGFDTLCKPYAGIQQLATATTGTLSYAGADMLVWFDPVQNRFGMDVAMHDGQQYMISEQGFHVDLYLEGPDTLVGRGAYIGSNVQAQLFKNLKGYLGIAVTMSRLPGVAATQ